MTTCEECYAIVNTNIIDVELGKVDSNMSLVIQDNYILKIGKARDLNIPPNATKINGKNKFLIPGLWDMHAHTSSDSITRQVAYPLFIANGITGIRDMIADCYNEEYPCDKYNSPSIDISRKWRKDVTNRNLLGPRSVLGSQRVNGPRGDSSTVLSPGTPEHGRKLVKFLKTRGIDFIKIYDEVPRDVYFAVADQAKKEHMIFAGHVPITVKASETSTAGQKSIEHCGEGNLFEECSSIEEEIRKKLIAAFDLDEPNVGQIVLEMVRTFDSIKCDRVFDIFKENGTWFTPTLIVKEGNYPYYSYDWKKDKRLKYLPKSEIDLWYNWDAEWEAMWGKWDSTSQAILRNMRFALVDKMNKKEIPMLAGSDCAAIGVFWGSSIHEELELLVQAGLSEFEAIKTATINPALFLQATDSLGSISKGKLADLLILDDNPLSDITNTQKISGVITNGRYFNRAELDSLLLSVETNVKNNFK